MIWGENPTIFGHTQNQGPVEDNGHLQQQKGKAGCVFATVNVETLIIWLMEEIPNNGRDV